MNKRIITTLVVSLGLLIPMVVLYFTFRPHKPSMTLDHVIVHALVLNQTTNGLSSTFEVLLTIGSRDKNVVFHYEQLIAFMSYKNYRITSPALTLPFTQDSSDYHLRQYMSVMGDVPLSQQLATALVKDRRSKRVMLEFKMHGRVKWKVGMWPSMGLITSYRLRASCAAPLIGNGERPPADTRAPMYRTATRCDVKI